MTIKEKIIDVLEYGAYFIATLLLLIMIYCMVAPASCNRMKDKIFPSKKADTTVVINIPKVDTTKVDTTKVK